MTHPAIGRLRGRAEPDSTLLDRLRSLHPAYTVSWQPNQQQWYICERRGSPEWREAGIARLARYAKEGPDKMDADIYFMCELMTDGDHVAYVFPDNQFGTDHMFRVIAEGEAATRSLKLQIERSLNLKEQGDVEAELELNAEFRERMMALYPEIRKRVLGNFSVAVA